MTKTNLWVGSIIILIAGFFIGSFITKDTTVSVQGDGVTMTATADGVAIWQFPDKRALDPDIFGTPQSPLNVELLPLAMRDVNTDSTAYTTIKKPLMFSNKIKKTTGSIKISVEDLTALDNPNSKDKAEVEANFKGPNGEDFKVILKKLIPVGPDHPFFGGVGTNVLMHGDTGIGTPLVAREFSYITLWGVGDLYKNGELVDKGRIIHVMVSERTRDDDFKVGFGVAKPDELEIHLALPPKKGSPKGPIDSPVPTGVTLPNGVEQPFMHVNFYGNIVMTGNQFVK
jgi:hypothetical protein